MRTPTESTREPRLLRTRWAAIGAAVAVTIGGGGLFIADAASGPASATVTVDPVRILDTRDPLNLGLPGPFVSQVGQDLQVTGPIATSGGTQTVVPDGATGVLLNVTAFNPTADGFVSVRPADATGAPTSSNLNVKAGDTFPNAVTVQVPTAGADKGKIEITYDALGVTGPTSEIFVDVVGYLQQGAAGPKGDKGDRGLSAWDTLPAGQSVTGEVFYDTHQHVAVAGTDYVLVPFPFTAPAPVEQTDVLFAAGSGYIRADASCSGTVAAPTAPAGKVCVYPANIAGVEPSGSGSVSTNLKTRGFGLSFAGTAPQVEGFDRYFYGTWAYTAP